MQAPHDTLFRYVMSHPQLAGAWVKSRLPAALPAAIDWDTLAPANGHTIGARLRTHAADLVFTAQLRDRRGFVVFIIEHKSAPDAEVHYQVLRDSVHVRHALRRQLGKRPRLLALLCSHGEPFAGAVGDPDLPAELDTAFRQFEPRVPMLVDDLATRTEDELLTSELPTLVRLTFACLQFARGRDPTEVLAALDRWAPLLREVEAQPGPPDGGEALDAIGWYLVETSDLSEEQIRMAYGKHLDQPENQRMTTGQRIRMESRNLGREEGLRQGLQQGLEKGLEKGRAEGHANLLLRLLQRRFGGLPAGLQERVRAADLADIERWTDRVLDAGSLAAVFAD